MAGKRITIVQGHPDPAGGHFVYALADSYERAACEAGHGIFPVRTTVIGMVEGSKDARDGCLTRLAVLGV